MSDTKELFCPYCETLGINFTKEQFDAKADHYEFNDYYMTTFTCQNPSCRKLVVVRYGFTSHKPSYARGQ